MECIILAGGLGTRLRSVIGAQPKCMAEVAGKPFLFYLLDYLVTQKCTRVILSLGYMHEVITGHPGLKTFPLIIDFVIEEQPLGTGGGIRLAMNEAREANVAVINGDTMFQVDFAEMLRLHETRHADVTLALKPMEDFDRYGAVTIDDQQLITAFHEKAFRASGLINGGVYIIKRTSFLAKTKDEIFSFEKEYLEPAVPLRRLAGYRADTYFIDIGIPSDFEKAQRDFSSGIISKQP
ncbi:MAG: nucleotidyltransferase family protein [Rubrivivax sp.]